MDLGCLLVKKAPRVDVHELCVRINEKIKPDGIEWYDYVHLRSGDRRITCKLRGDDIPQIKNPSMYHIYVSEYLRNKLGVKINEEPKFDVQKATRWLIPYYFIRYHPNDIVRVSTRLGVIGVFLGVLAIVLALVLTLT